MYLLSIQGKYAPAFELRGNAASQLKKQLEGDATKEIIVISTRFRSDLIYLDNTINLVTALHKWCSLVGVPYQDSLKLKFFRSEEENTSFYYFFQRLHLIRRIPGWHNLYVENLQKVLLTNREHPLQQNLSEALHSYLYLLERQNENREKEFTLKKVSKFLNLHNLACKNKDSIN